MRPRLIYRRTAAFVWRKFGLCMLMLALAAGLFCLMVVLTMPVSKVLGGGMFVLWLCLCAVGGYLFYTNVLYMLHAAQVASVTRCLTSGSGAYPTVPEATHAARRRFGTKNHCSGITKQVHRSVLQLQRYFERVTDDVGEVPGMQTLLAIGKYLEHLMLTYLTDGCIGYLFWCSDLGVFTAAKESVAVYAYNWNRLTEKSGETAALTIGSTVICAAGAAVGLSAAFEAMKIGSYSFFGAILGIALVLILKYAFLDSYLTVRAIHNLLECAQDTVLSDSLYVKLSGASGAYRSLCAASRAQEARKQNTEKRRQAARDKQPASIPPKTRVCPNCGTVNPIHGTNCNGCHLALR